MARNLFLLALAAVVGFAAPAWALEGPAAAASSPPAASARPTVFIADKDVSVGDSRLFGAYEDNSLLWHRMRNNRWAESDAAALRIHYSLRYVLKSSAQYAFFASYTGEFDFYWGTRPSDPVINRLSNPALRYQWNLDQDNTQPSPGKFLEVALEHASTGQVIEASGPAGNTTAQRVYTERYQPYFDQLSRGSNFVSVAARLPQSESGQPMTVMARARLYLDQDSAVTWGPLAGQGVRLSDYHRISVRMGKHFPGFGIVEAQWTVGDKGFKTDSLDLAWQCTGGGCWGLPLYVRYHVGPLNTLSNYTQRQDSIGIGLRFAAF